MIKALIPLAEGCEEIEAVTLIDTLRRADWEVTAAGLTSDPITASRGVQLIPDCTWDEIDSSTFDVIALPGGLAGMEHLRADRRVIAAIQHQAASNKLIAAVCAAPLVLEKAGLLKGTSITSHPSVKDQFAEVNYLDARVVQDGQIVTSRGPGTTLEFALKLIALLDGEDKARAIGQAMLCCDAHFY